MKSETEIEKGTRDLILNKLGVQSTKLNLWGQVSNPDVIFWMPGGKPLVVEFKKPGKKPTKKQFDRMDELKKLGYNVTWTDSQEWLFSYVKTILEGK